MLICLQCGAEVSPAKTCSNCGERLVIKDAPFLFSSDQTVGKPSNAIRLIRQKQKWALITTLLAPAPLAIIVYGVVFDISAFGPLLFLSAFALLGCGLYTGILSLGAASAQRAFAKHIQSTAAAPRICFDCRADLPTDAELCFSCGSNDIRIAGMEHLKANRPVINANEDDARPSEYGKREKRIAVPVLLLIFAVAFLHPLYASRKTQQNTTAGSPATQAPEQLHDATPVAEAPQSTTTMSEPQPEPGTATSDVYWSGGIPFRHEGADWVRNDMPNVCGGPDGGDYLDICRLTGNDATAADNWEAAGRPPQNGAVNNVQK